MSSSQTFPNASGFNLAFTTIAVSETDSGSVTPFIGQISTVTLLPVAGGEIEWAGFHTGVIAPGGSETLDFSYDVSSTNAADAITNLGLSMVPDSSVAAGVSLTAVETVYDPTTNAELGQITVNLANPTAPPYTAGDIPLSIGETSLKVDVQVIASVSSTAASSAQATFSEIDQTFGQTPLTSLASIGDNVFLDTADTGIQSGVNAGPGVAGVTVDLENSAGTVLETTTTNSQGLYDFTNLTPGTYQVQFVAPSGYTLSPQTSIANDLGSAPNQATGITAPITLTSGETLTNIDAGLVPLSSTGGTSPSGPSISVIKVPGSMVVNNCGQVTYTIDVTNTGNTNLYNLQVTDNIGTASNPDDITATPVLSNGYNVGDTSHSGVFTAGETWQYTVTVSYQTPSGGQSGQSSGDQGQSCDINQQSGQWGQSGGWSSTGDNGQQGGSGQSGWSSGGQGGQWGQSGGWSSSGDNGQQGWSGQSGWSSGGQSGQSSGGQSSSGSQGQNCDTNQQSGQWGQSGGWSTSGDNGQQGGSGQGGWSSGGQSGQGGQSSGGQSSGGQGQNCDTNQQSGQWGQSGGWSTSSDNGQQGGSGQSGWSSGGQSGQSSGGQSSSGSQGQNCDTNQQSGQWGQSGGWSTSGDNGQQGGSGQGGWSSGGQGGQSGQSSGGQGQNCEQTSPGCEQQPSNGNTGYADTVTVTASTCPPSSSNSGGCDDQQGGQSGQSSSGQGQNCDTNQQGGQSGGWSSAGDNGQQGGSGWSSGGQSGQSGQSSGGQGQNCDTNQQGGQSGSWSSAGDNGQQGWSGQSGWGSGDQSGQSGQSSGGQGQNCDTNQQSGQWGQSSGWSTSGDNGQQGGSGWSSGGQSGQSSGSQGQNCDTNPQGGSGSTGSSGNDNQNSGSTSCVTVTATDTKEIQVLAANSDITVGGTAPTGNLASLYGTAQTLEFTYNPGDTVSLASGSTALASVTGANSQSMAFLEISNNANPFASGGQIYFEGSVNAGENIYADAALNPLTNTANTGASSHFSTTPGAETYAFIFGNQADFNAGDAPIQTMTYDTTGTHGMSLGDTIGSLKLAGYIGDHGGHLVA